MHNGRMEGVNIEQKTKQQIVENVKQDITNSCFIVKQEV